MSYDAVALPITIDAMSLNVKAFLQLTRLWCTKAYVIPFPRYLISYLEHSYFLSLTNTFIDQFVDGICRFFEMDTYVRSFVE